MYDFTFILSTFYRLEFVGSVDSKDLALRSVCFFFSFSILLGAFFEIFSIDFYWNLFFFNLKFNQIKAIFIPKLSNRFNDFFFLSLNCSNEWSIFFRLLFQFSLSLPLFLSLSEPSSDFCGHCLFFEISFFFLHFFF